MKRKSQVFGIPTPQGELTDEDAHASMNQTSSAEAVARAREYFISRGVPEDVVRRIITGLDNS